MVSTVSNTLFKRLIDAFPADRAYARQDFARDPMPKPLSDYLEQLLLGQAQTLASPGSRWVDLDHPEVKEARRMYLEALSRHQRIPASEWRDVLGSACLKTMSYLVRPATTLTDAIFGDETGTVASDVVFARMRPFTAYPYFKDVVSAYFEQKNVNQIDRERFRSLVKRIDRQMTSDFGSSEWLRMLEPLMSVLGKIPELSGGLPVEVLRAFLEEKQASELLARLNAGFSAHRVIKESDLALLFEEEVIEIADPQADLRPQENGRGPVPLWKQFQGTPAVATAAVNEVPTAKVSSEPLWKQFRKEPAANEVISDLAALEVRVLGDRGARNRDIFVKHLFAGSRDDYQKTLHQLRQAENWSEASQIIAQEVFLKHQVNIYSDPAVSFTDAAEAQYRS